ARARDPARRRARLALQPALAGCSYRGGRGSAPVDRPRDQAEGRGAVSGAGTREAGPGIVPAPGIEREGALEEKRMNGWSPDKTWREECGIFAAFGVPRAAEIVGLGL